MWENFANGREKRKQLLEEREREEKEQFDDIFPSNWVTKAY